MAPKTQQTPRVLIIDQAPDAEAIAAALKQAMPRVQIRAIADAAAFIDVLSGGGGPVDAAVTDFELSWSNGIAVTRALKSYRPDCAVVMYASTGSEEVPVQALKAGVEEYVVRSPDSVERLAATVAGVVERARRRREAAQAEGEFRELVENLLIGAFRAAPDGRLLEANAAMAHITGHVDRQSLLDKNLFEMFVDAKDLARWRGEMDRVGTVENLEIRLRRRDGVLIWGEVSARTVRGGDGRAKHYEGSLENISERKWTEERLNYLAYYDSLTGLPNRMRFNQQLDQLIRDREGRHAVFFLDLDRFKYINDTLGHDAGDQLLQAVAARLSASAREDAVLARLSGDQFGLIVPQVSPEEIRATGQNLIGNFSQPFYIVGRELFLTASAGVSVYPGDGQEAEDLIKHAEVALYRAKAQGRNTFQFYTSDMLARVSRQLSLEHALRRALEREELAVHYQPQVDLTSGRLAGIEALLRWRRPGAAVAPAEFIPIAEETGMIVPIGEWVLRTACRQNKRWQEDGLAFVPIAVNFSASQFQQPAVIETIARALDESGLPARTLELELTESLLMQNTQRTTSVLQELSNMGVMISIDDFGTGYSSLSYLTRFPIHALKIDQSFVRGIGRNASNRAIALAIIAMARSLNLHVVAEGVETEDQAKFLRTHHGEVIQGHYISPPLPPERFTRFLKDRVQSRPSAS